MVKSYSKTGILIVGHGSRREEANADVRRAAGLIGERGKFDLVQAAFLEIEMPDIKTGYSRLVESGADSITVHPYFLSPGRHTRGDLPYRVAEAALLYPEVSYRVTEPLSAHRLVIEASLERIEESLGQEIAESRFPQSSNQPEIVYLVGAGPGDPGLLTVRAAELLRSCDVVVYDYLVSPEIFGLINKNADSVYVGKIGGGSQTPQTEINRLLIERAGKGERVVRLKGGDPFIFGRGGEEADALQAAGIKFEVVPGISSALAAPAYAGIPLTHRGLSSSVSIVTGTQISASATSIGSHAKPAGTLVILMGLSRLSEIAEELIGSGLPAETPIAVIASGTCKTQRTITGTIATIAGEVKTAQLKSPSVIVVGAVVSLRERLKWFQAEPTELPFIEHLAATKAAKPGE